MAGLLRSKHRLQCFCAEANNFTEDGVKAIAAALRDHQYMQEVRSPQARRRVSTPARLHTRGKIAASRARAPALRACSATTAHLPRS